MQRIQGPYGYIFESSNSCRIVHVSKFSTLVRLISEKMLTSGCDSHKPMNVETFVYETKISGPVESDESELGRSFRMKTPSILANSSILRDVKDKVFHVLA